MQATLRVLLILQCFAALARAGVSQQQIDQWVDKSAIVFTGEMLRLGSNVQGLETKDGAMVVQLDEIKDGDLYALEAVGLVRGAELTVVADPLLGIQPPQQGLTVVFFVNPYMYEKNVAVSATAITEVARKSNFFDRLSASVQRKNEEPLKHAVESAASIVTGTVKEVRPLPDDKVKALRSIDNGRDLYSEHSPTWQEAVIDVESVLRGDASVKAVIVIFPSTNDRSWAKSPRFASGQTGTWLLHDNEITKAEAAVLLGPEKIAGRDIKAYTALNPPDFQLRDSAGKNEARVNEFVKKFKR